MFFGIATPVSSFCVIDIVYVVCTKTVVNVVLFFVTFSKFPAILLKSPNCYNCEIPDTERYLSSLLVVSEIRVA